MLYQHALKLAEQNARSSKAVSYRMKLIQADLVVDPKKNSTQPPPPQNLNQGAGKGGRVGASRAAGDGQTIEIQ